MKQTITLALVFLALISFANAQPTMPEKPHQFYGQVEINGEPAPNNTEVKATYKNNLCESVDALNGHYGYRSDDSIFKVPAECGNRSVREGGTLEFYVKNKKAAEYDFSSGRLTQLNLSVEISGEKNTDTEDSSGSDSDSGGGGFSMTNEPPVAGFDWTTPVRPGETVTLDASGSFDPDGSISEYQWSVGETGETVETVFGDTGKHPVTLKVIDSSGEQTSVTKNVVVRENKAPVAKFNILYSEPDVRENVVLNATNSYDPDGEIDRYEWSFDDRGEKVTRSFPDTGKVEVTLTVLDDEGKQSSMTRELTEPDSEKNYTEEINESEYLTDPTGSFSSSAPGAVAAAIGTVILLAAAAFIGVRKEIIALPNPF